MNSKEAKKEQIRKQIVCAAQNYSADLAGKVFLYVYGEKFFEIIFPTNCFMHLSGVDSSLPAKAFYEYAKSGILTNDQFFFQKHTYYEAKRKLPCLNRLSELTSSLVCVVIGLTTVSLTYKIGLTNLEFTLGLTEHTDSCGKAVDNLYIPRTLRVKDRSVEKSAYSDFIDFIFVRDASKKKYETVSYADQSKVLPSSIKELLDPKTYDSLRNTES